MLFPLLDHTPIAAMDTIFSCGVASSCRDLFRDTLAAMPKSVVRFSLCTCMKLMPDGTSVRTDALPSTGSVSWAQVINFEKGFLYLLWGKAQLTKIPVVHIQPERRITGATSPGMTSLLAGSAHLCVFLVPVFVIYLFIITFDRPFLRHVCFMIVCEFWWHCYYWSWRADGRPNRQRPVLLWVYLQGLQWCCSLVGSALIYNASNFFFYTR